MLLTTCPQTCYCWEGLFHHGDRFNDYLCIAVLPLMTNYFGDRFIDSLSTDMCSLRWQVYWQCPLTCVHCGDRFIDGLSTDMCSLWWQAYWQCPLTCVHCSYRFIDSLSTDMCSLWWQVYWQSVHWHVFDDVCTAVTGLTTIRPLTCCCWQHMLEVWGWIWLAPTPSSLWNMTGTPWRTCR